MAKKNARKSKNDITLDISKLEAGTQVFTIQQPQVVELLKTIPAMQNQGDEQQLNNSISKYILKLTDQCLKLLDT